MYSEPCFLDYEIEKLVQIKLLSNALFGLYLNVKRKRLVKAWILQVKHFLFDWRRNELLVSVWGFGRDIRDLLE